MPSRKCTTHTRIYKFTCKFRYPVSQQLQKHTCTNMHIHTHAGVSFAIPIDMAKAVIDQLIKYGEVQRAVLGISYLQRRPTAAESVRTGLPNITTGVIVLDVPEGSPCAKAGMLAAKRPLVDGAKAVVGDVIVAIDGYPVKDPLDLNVVSAVFPAALL